MTTSQVVAPRYDKKKMLFRPLGPSGLRVSLLSLGTWLTVGGKISDELTQELVWAAYNAGVTTFDTAEVYSNGEAERALGKAIRNLNLPRSSLVLITKIYFGDGGTDPNATGLSRKHVLEAAEKSLQRAGVGYWDCILAHQPDPTVPMEEVVRAFNRLIESDRCFYWGTSGWSSESITEATEIAARLKLHAPIADQPQYSMLHRCTLEDELLPVFEKFRYGSTTWSPLHFGILTGKYNEGIPSDSRFATDRAFFASRAAGLSTPEGKQTLDKVRGLTRVAEERLRCKVATLAIAWTLLQPDLSTCILGATSVAQLRENLAALDVLPRLQQDAALREEIEQILKNKPQVKETARPLN